MLNTFWLQNVLPAMMMMTNQLSAVAMYQVMVIGTFFDAKMQLETQQLLQRLQAEAHKDYHPSEGICTIGTNVRSLAASERRSEMTSLLMSRRFLDRQLRNASTAGGTADTDVTARIQHFRDTYCNPADNNGALEALCGTTGGPTARQNKDIDFTRTIATPLTLNVNFTAGAGTPTPDEEDVLAMAANLYAHRLLPSDLQDNILRDEQLYLDFRALAAKRSVAQNSFNALVGMKAEGSVNDEQYMYAILEELGISDNAEIVRLLGENPSYYAQMELLTKKALQSPQFYINLYDKPTNVTRKGVALQALSLMQNRDLFKSSLRTEAILSLLLELELEDEQNTIGAKN